MTTTRLLVVRHGETAFNAEGRIQGHSDSELTAKGLDQARATADALVNRGIDHIYASDLGRARATAEILADRVGREVQLDPRLREMGFGRYEGRTWEELTALFRDLPAPEPVWFTGRPPEGETRAEVTARAVQAMSDFVRRHPGRTLAVVAHGGLIGLFFRHVLELPVDRAYVGFRTRNCAIHTFEHRDDRFHLQTWGEVGHLG